VVNFNRLRPYDNLKPTTHVPEIGAKNQKNDTGFWRVWHAIQCRIFLVSVSGNE